MLKKRISQLGRIEGRTSNKLITMIIIVAVIAVCVVFNVRGRAIEKQTAEDIAVLRELQAEYESESARAAELEEYSKYVNTKQFAEKIARDKMGLIYEDEIVFRAEDDE